MVNFFFSASDFLYLVTEYYSFGKSSTIAALDLTSCIPVKPICKVKLYPYPNSSDPNIQITITNPNYEYSVFLSMCMENFRNEFMSSLFRQFDDTSDDNLVEETNLLRLLRNQPSKKKERILTKYLTARCHDWWPMLQDDKIFIFDFASILLYNWQSNSSSLCFLLLIALKINNPLPEMIICATDPPARLDFIIQRAQTYCNEIQCPDLFRLFKYSNCIFGCLRYGLPDMLDILLNYGNWKSHFKGDADPEATINLHITFPGHRSEMYELRSVSNYHLYRRKLIYYIFDTFCADIELRERYISALKLFWKSIPFPFIQPDEIYKEFITNDSLPVERDHVIEVIDLYKSTLGPIKLHSRSLKHLARCAIRSFLDKKSLLPGGIENFGKILPKIIITYLKLKE